MYIHAVEALQRKIGQAILLTMWRPVLFAIFAGIHMVEAFTFFSSHGLHANMQQSRASSTCSSPTHQLTRMAVERGEGVHTRAEAIQTFWRASTLALGATQVLSLSAFAEDEVVTASGLRIKKLANGKGPSVVVGDLIGVRFKGTYNAFEFDNVFNTPEPYYMRAGVGTLVQGVEEAILMMHVGDRWEIKCPASLAFGSKGRPPSPGRPRIPPGAEVEFVVELVSLPGKEVDILDLSDEPLTGPAFDSA